MRGVCPQKVLSDFQAFTPARTFVKPRTTASRRPLSLSVKRQTNNNMIMKFLLHKDLKEIATAQMAHLVLPDTKANASQNQKSHFLPTH